MNEDTEKKQSSLEDEFINTLGTVFDPNDVVESKSDNQLQEELEKKQAFKVNKGRNSKQSHESAGYENESDENFQDFLIYKNLAGNKSSFSDKNRIPKENIHYSGKTVEIEVDNKFHSKHSSEQTGIILQRDESNTIKRIEIICSCGERTVIDLEYENEQKQ